MFNRCTSLVDKIQNYEVTAKGTVKSAALIVLVLGILGALAYTFQLWNFSQTHLNISLIMMGVGGGVLGIFGLVHIYKKIRYPKKDYLITDAQCVKLAAKITKQKPEEIENHIKEQFDHPFRLDPHNQDLLSWLLMPTEELLNKPLSEFTKLSNESLYILLARKDIKALIQKGPDESKPTDALVLKDFFNMSASDICKNKKLIPDPLLAFVPRPELSEVIDSFSIFSERQLTYLFFFSVEVSTAFKHKSMECINELLKILPEDFLDCVPIECYTNPLLKLHAKHVNKVCIMYWHNAINGAQLYNMLRTVDDTEFPLNNLTKIELGIFFPKNKQDTPRRLRNFKERINSIAYQLDGELLYYLSNDQFEKLPFGDLTEKQFRDMLPLEGMDIELNEHKDITRPRLKLLQSAALPEKHSRVLKELLGSLQDQ